MSAQVIRCTVTLFLSAVMNREMCKYGNKACIFCEYEWTLALLQFKAFSGVLVLLCVFRYEWIS